MEMNYIGLVLVVEQLSPYKNASATDTVTWVIQPFITKRVPSDVACDGDLNSIPPSAAIFSVKT